MTVLESQGLLLISFVSKTLPLCITLIPILFDDLECKSKPLGLGGLPWTITITVKQWIIPLGTHMVLLISALKRSHLSLPYTICVQHARGFFHSKRRENCFQKRQRKSRREVGLLCLALWLFPKWSFASSACRTSGNGCWRIDMVCERVAS